MINGNSNYFLETEKKEKRIKINKRKVNKNFNFVRIILCKTLAQN